MDKEVVYQIKKYHKNIKHYLDFANESRKLSWRLFYNILEKYFEDNPVPKELESLKCKVIDKLYRRIESKLINCQIEEGELIGFFERVEKIIENKRFRISLLEKMIKI